MVEKVQRTRKIAGIAVGAVRAIFRTGRAWGTARTRVKTARRPTPTVAVGVGPDVAAGVAAGAAGAYFLDPQNGKRRRQIAADRVTKVLRRGESESNAEGDGERPPAEPAATKVPVGATGGGKG